MAPSAKTNALCKRLDQINYEEKFTFLPLNWQGQGHGTSQAHMSEWGLRTDWGVCIIELITIAPVKV